MVSARRAAVRQLSDLLHRDLHRLTCPAFSWASTATGKGGEDDEDDKDKADEADFDRDEDANEEEPFETW